MALIGNWGDFTFYVSADQIKTFDSLKWDSAAKYSTHDRHLREPLLEFTGTDVETITFTMFFSVFLGVNPIKEMATEWAVQRIKTMLSLPTSVKSNRNWKP